MTGEDGIFEFERDFAGSLQCIPMAVRFKLDLAGIKLSLRHWNRIGRDERDRLLTQSCAAPAELDAWREHLTTLICGMGEAPAPLPEPADLAWADAHAIPAQITAFAVRIGVAPPSPAQWVALSALQRFTLLKLSRDHHDNVNFLPALREFGVMAGPAQGTDA